MARRAVFVPHGKPNHLVDETLIDFKWSPGFAVVQKKKNVSALHEAAKAQGLFPLLEVSTKSEESLGQSLSAFNLRIKTDAGEICVESAFQGSKLFERGGPFTDIYAKDGYAAKKDERIKSSGRLIGFRFLGQEWPLIPKTAFYDWLYITALRRHEDYIGKLLEYNGFTDIEFNPEKSINCQARTCALLVSLVRLDSLDVAMKSQTDFIATGYPKSVT